MEICRRYSLTFCESRRKLAQQVKEIITRSIWTGDTTNAFFSSETFNRYRVLMLAEYEYSKKSGKSAYYVLGVDVGRFNCNTEIVVFKVTPQGNGNSIKSVVNIFSSQAEDFEQQALKLKKLYYKYRANKVVIDANGIGTGFIDFMTKSQIDPETLDVYPPFGVSGGTFVEVMEQYKKINRKADIEENAMYLVKANAGLNTEIHTYVQTQMNNGRLRFLIDEMQARNKLMTMKLGNEMDPDQRAAYLIPYTLTTVLREQMLNLKTENEGFNIILKQNSRSIPKDKYSALSYGLLYIKRKEENEQNKHKRDLSKMVLFN